MARTLVVYYSRTGATKRAATEIATALNADIEELVDPAKRSGIFGYLRCVVAGTFRTLAHIEGVKHDPADYDVVVVGTPVWNASMSSPVRRFLRRHRGDMKAVAFFSVCADRGGHRTVREMEREAGKVPVAVLVLDELDVSVLGAAAPGFRGFVERVRDTVVKLRRLDGAGTRPLAPVR